MTAVSFPTIRAAIAKVRTVLATDGYAGSFGLGPRPLTSRSNPLAGAVAILAKGDAAIQGPRLLGGNPRAVFTVVQPLEIHCYAKAAPQSDASTQYEADLEAAEQLTSNILRAFEIYIPGAKRGGRRTITGADVENLNGVEIVATITIDLESPDSTYELATGVTFVPDVELVNTHGSTNPADWTSEPDDDP